MKKITLLLLSCILFLSFPLLAQPDVETGTQGAFTLIPIFHGSVVIIYGKEVIYIDPYGDKGLYDGLPAPTIICLTHPHGDHTSRPTLEALDLSKATFVWPEAVKELVGDLAKNDDYSLKNDQSVNIRGVEVMAVPMYNLPNDAAARHKKGWGNGYVITLSGKRIYLSGDTEDIPEMRQLKSIDYAFICMNQPFTMKVEQAASAVMDFKPAVVYPYHFRGAGGVKSDVDEFKRIIEASGISTEVRLREWYPTP
jgi:L-ascorbate metabolism protein UlaG (beta-lactamase superfamily)